MEPETEGGAPAFSPEWMACLLAEAEALLAERVSAAVRARWRREVKLPRMSLEGCLEQLSEARRGREALLARDGALSEAKQERLQTFLRLEMALLREMQALRERALASAYAIAKKGEPPPGLAREEAGGGGGPAGRGGEGEAPRPASPGKEEGAAARAAPVMSAAEAASQAKAAAQREALEEALWEPGGVGDLIAKGSDLQFSLEKFLGERLGEALRELERAVREEGRARVRQLLGVRDALEEGGWAERAEALRREAGALRGEPRGLREKAAALRSCLQEAPLEELRPLLEKAVALLEKTDSWWVAWLEKALWAAPLEEAEAARKEAEALRAALEEDEEGALLRALQAEGGSPEEAAPRWGSLEEMRDALQSAPFDEVFALLKKPLALREALQNAPEPEEQGELLGVLEVLEEAFCQPRPGAWQEKLQGLRRARWEEEAAVLLEKVWSLKTEVYLLISDLDREEKVAVLMEELRGLQEAVRGAPLADQEALREKLGALQAALQEIPVKEVLLLRNKAKALRKKATDFWTDPLDEADGLLEEVDALREILTGSPLKEALWGKLEDLRGGMREIAKKKISVLSYYLWNVLWSPLWKKVGDMQRALWKTPRKEEGVVQEKLGDLEHALDEILEDNLSGLPRILYALPGIVTALQKKVHAVRESLQETPPEMAVALQGKVVAMQEALWKIPFKEAHLMQEDLKAYCLTLQKKVEAWWARSLEGSSSRRRAALPEEVKGTPGTERSESRVTRDGPDAGASQMDPVVGGIRHRGVSAVSSPALPAALRATNPPGNESVNSGSARCFQYSVLKAIPHSHFQQRKDWYENTDQDLRDYVVQRLVHTIFPTPDLAVLKDHQVEKVVAYAKKVEGDVYESTNHWDVYCCLIMVKLFKIEKELREKRRFRLHKQGIMDTQASPVGETQPVVPLSCRLATPEVPLSHMQDPPGVNQLNPMSIWNIQNSPASLDPPAASPVNPPAQIHEETALMGQDPGSPLSYSVNTVPPVPHQALPGVQSQSTSLGQMGGAQVLAPGRLPTPEPPPQPLPPPCLKSTQGPGTLAEPHIGTRDAASHGLLGKRRRLAEGGWRASPAGPSPSALPDAPAQPSPVTLESLCRSLEDLRISVLRNLGAVHRQVEALEKRIHVLERWRAEMEGRQQPQQP
ncbi:uncharacterized protein LOC134488857 [Candoia aspera]|uniref:uncharacterized protein LOC134488857 n=1 Tax=Candoia aspera TaxID=51853 RepID=UPI002FD7F8A4